MKRRSRLSFLHRKPKPLTIEQTVFAENFPSVCVICGAPAKQQVNEYSTLISYVCEFPSCGVEYSRSIEAIIQALIKETK